ncbi:Flp family type IVb pilin [Kocuria sp. SM24M-10]|uniref:Flp family type IVb pilin n=1 Tax=Kocuria sp. SM24M-10 TaxID=1660349 RepID=UPI00064B4795|nr:Flp family type IVb pilin [Kocuria sp. SM24M-10]KLU11143.1 pilus assembly protein [Kocuria sp. SM24M-10]
MLPLLITIQNVFFDAADRLKKDEKGATAVEYGLIVGVIAVAILGALLLLDGQLNTMLTDIKSKVTA